jgi:DNA-binding NtrC family response regulator
MIEIYKMIGMLAGNRAPVLVRGETGTGKEMVARAIHYNSPQASEPFIAINCTALAETLLESELFGHVKGSFTGAMVDPQGLLRAGRHRYDLLRRDRRHHHDFQAKLLRVLQERRVLSGRRREAPEDPGAGHRGHAPADREAGARRGSSARTSTSASGSSRSSCPPSGAPGDIALLAEHLLARVAGELHRDVRALSDEALRELARYDWPGNVRELENALTRAVVLARGPVIGVEHLALGQGAAVPDPAETAPVGDRLDDVGRAHVRRILARTGGNKRQAARLLGISRPRLDRLLAEPDRVVTDRDHGDHGT